MKKELLISFIVVLMSFSLAIAIDSDNKNINNTENSISNISEDIVIDSINISEVEKRMDKDVSLPGDFGYGFKRFGENSRMFFTFGDERRFNYKYEMVNKRAIEMRNAIGKERFEVIKRLSKDYNKTIERIEEKLSEMKREGRDISRVQERISNMTHKHTLVLENNLEDVPEEARKGLENSLRASTNAHIRVRKEISQRKGKNETDAEIIEKFENQVRKGLGKDSEFCIQVITPAYNPETEECKEFRTSCDVPEGWERIKSCEDFKERDRGPRSVSSPEDPGKPTDLPV